MEYNLDVTEKSSNHVIEDDDEALPGFRFHPTDEEMVGFYLRRKVEKKPIGLELIKDADIYKYDPWDIPMHEEWNSSSEKEEKGYFFCKRARKYRNSVRPNRVTASGFWKATGIDRPVYSSSAGGSSCIIGLKKSLVFYRGSAGKGTKTDWMMHEFRLPPSSAAASSSSTSKQHIAHDAVSQDSEVWTICKIFKRKVSVRKPCIQDFRHHQMTSNPNTLGEIKPNMTNYISFSAPNLSGNHDSKKPYFCHVNVAENPNTEPTFCSSFFGPSPPITQPPSATAFSSFASGSSTACVDRTWTEDPPNPHNQTEPTFCSSFFGPSPLITQPPSATASSSFASGSSTACVDPIDGLFGYGDWEDLQSMFGSSFTF